MPGTHTNRLAGQTSPYLLQHAHNPVDWYPWGDEAFAEARRRAVPIFLSIGYSTCYWCHVMERESFESEPIARLMNERFVNIKVDREERPDIDDLYMIATQMLSGRGGWPMSAFLEPHTLRPFWCATYFPPEPRMGMPGFPQVLRSISDAWQNQRSEITQQAARVAEAVAEHLASGEAPAALGPDTASKTARALLQSLDRAWGGLGGSAGPKFPQPANLEFLLDLRDMAGDDATRNAIDEALRLTLDKMAIGGLRDQIGGGFHRYSVDQTWTVPHFEKMLYDNAQLIRIYARAAALYRDEFYRAVVTSTIDYLQREMTGEHGAFCSAQDAEVDGREGANYVWTPRQIREALQPDDADFAIKVYTLDRGPNFRDPHHADDEPVNVLRMEDRPERLAAAMNIPPGEFLQRLDRVNRHLHSIRAARKQPRLNDKVLTSWNALAIQALADAARLLENRDGAALGARAAAFIAGHMRACPDGRSRGLFRSFRDGRASTPAFLEDYACLIAALAALARADPAGAGPHLLLAADLALEADDLFGDAATGAFFDARAGAGDLFLRPRSLHDGAIPSGSSLMLHALLDLYELTREPRHLDRAMRLLSSMSGIVARSPVSSTSAVRAILRFLRLGQGDALAALGAPVEDGGAHRPPEDFTPVEVYADTERIEIAPDHPAQFRIILRIADGYHITAADPGTGGAGLIPLRIHTIGGEGIAAFADYPPGEPWQGAPAGGEILIHAGEVEFPIAVERAGDWKGRPLLAITFQPCTDRECLAPVTVELDVAIDRTA